MPKIKSQFEAGFRRSRKGNLWRNYRGLTVTIFQRSGDGYYAWSIADGEEVRYSSSAFETEEETIDALFEELEQA
jgi:hypothetical protein